MALVNDQGEQIDVADLADQFLVKETKYVRALKQIQVERIREEIKMYQEIHAVMAKHQDKLAAFDKKRSAIISGEVEPTEDECKYEFADDSTTVEETEDKGIPDFWLQIFSNLDMFNQNVSDSDSEILKHLSDIRYDILTEPQGFKLTFVFKENDAFTNTELTKTYFYSDKIDPYEPLTHSQLVIDRTEGCKIDWKSPELNVTEKNGEKQDSFFNFFDPPTVKYSEAEPEDQELLTADFDMGETLYSSIIPRAIVYYTGEGIEDDYEDDDEFDEDDEYDEDEDEEEDEQPAAAAIKPHGHGRRGPGRRRGGNNPAGGAQPPECKNQ